MNRTFCKDCGRATEYSLNKPRLCAFCGHPFTSFSTPVPSSNASVTLQKTPNPLLKTKPVVSNHSTDDDDDYDNDSGDDIFVPDGVTLKDMDVEILRPNKNKTTVADLAVGAKVNIKEINKMRVGEGNKSKKISNKKFLEDFAREAGSIRPYSRSRKNKGGSN